MWTTLSSHLSSGAACATPSQTFEMNKRRMEMEDVSWIAGPVFEILAGFNARVLQTLRLKVFCVYRLIESWIFIPSPHAK